VFQASPSNLPAYTGAVNDRGGYSIYKVVKVIDAPSPDAGKLASAGSRVGEQLGRELLTAYLGSLKANTEVKINQSALEKSNAK
jgi:peptidyl-prolyl cis-trans isomerase D